MYRQSGSAHLCCHCSLYLAVSRIFSSLVAPFSSSLVIHLFQAASSHLWFLLPTIALGVLAEVVGWAGRLWSSKAADTLEPFLMQCVLSCVSANSTHDDLSFVQTHPDNRRTHTHRCCQFLDSCSAIQQTRSTIQPYHPELM